MKHRKSGSRLCDRFVRKKKIIEFSQRNGNATVHKKSWKFFEIMSFYKNYCCPKQITTNASSTKQSNSKDETIDLDNTSNETPIGLLENETYIQESNPSSKRKKKAIL